MTTYTVSPHWSDGDRTVRVTTDERALPARVDLTPYDEAVYGWGNYSAGAVILAATILADAYDDEFAREHAETVARGWLSDVEAAQFRISRAELDNVLPAEVTDVE